MELAAFLLTKERAAGLRAEHEVNHDVSQGLGHGCDAPSGLGYCMGRLAWAYARRTRSSPGCHIRGFQPRQECYMGRSSWAFARRTRSGPGSNMMGFRP